MPFATNAKIQDPSSSIGKFLGDKSNGEFPVDVKKWEEGSKSAASSMQVIGLNVCVFFFIVGWVIMVLAAGLKHPEYKKWARGSLFASCIAYLAIKIGPIIIYRL